jgi:preprotein translocase subunit SecG
MIALIVVIHIIVCLTLVTVVLLQQGKGADVGAVFGGSSSTVFGASGAGNLLTKITWGCAIVFFTTSLLLAYASTRRATGSIFEGGHVTIPVAPASKTAAPALPPISGAPAANHPAAPSTPSGSK